MSSHHIVREKQEPALLILGMETFPTELLGQLLEWNPTVITTEQTAEALVENGIKIDWVITDDVRELLQSDTKTIARGSDNYTEAGLKYLITHGYPAVNIITDDLELKDFLFFVDKINLVIFQGNQKIYAVSSGFSKWKPKGEAIEILTQPNHLHYDGLEPIGNHCYQTIHDGFFSLEFDQSFLFIVENL